MPPLLFALLLSLQGPVSETLVTAPRAHETATSSPALVTVITAEELAATGERSLPRAIGRAANLWVQETNLGGGSPVVNGLIGNRILIVVDGVRLNDATTREGPNQALNQIDPAIVERIEVLRGPSSVLYGSDAMGGAILIWTKRRLPLGQGESGKGSWRGALDLFGSSAASGGRGALSLSEATESDGWLAIGSLQDWGDLESAGGEVDHTGYHGNALFGSWVHALDPHRTLRFSGRSHREFDVPRTDRLNPGFGQSQPSNQVWNFKLQDREAYLLAYADEEGGLLADRMEARLSLRRYIEQREVQRTASSTFTFEEDEVTSGGLGVDWQRALGDDHLLTWGFDLDTDAVDSSRTDTDLGTGAVNRREGAFAEDSRYTSGGLFVQDEIFAFEPFDLTLGVRYSHFDFSFDGFPSQGGGREEGDFGAFTASAAAARDVAEGVRLVASLGQAFRAPNLDDLAKNGQFAGGTELANPDLDPEESWTAQLALDAARPSWSMWVGLYYTEITDLIGRRLVDPGDPSVPGDETFLRDNVGRAEIWGVDLGHRRRLGGEDSPYSLDLLVGYARGQQFDDTVDPGTGTAPFDDVPFRRIPPLHGSLGVRWDDRSPGRGLDWAEVAVSWADEQDRLHPQDASDPRIDPSGTDGWGVIDLEVGGPLGFRQAGSSWTAGVHNVLDEDYRVHGSGFDAPGRSMVVGLHLSF